MQFYKPLIKTESFAIGSGCRVVLILLMVIAGAGVLHADEAVDPHQVEAHMRYAVLADTATIRAEATLNLQVPGRRIELPAGTWRFEATDIRPASKRYHVFPKTFQPGERAEMEVYMATWQARGFDPEVETFGLLFRTPSGRMLDNRVHWVSLARFATEDEAQSLITQLRGESVWAWMRPERTGEGAAVFRVRDTHGNTLETLEAPIKLTSSKPIELQDMSSSFWQQRQANRLLHGSLRLAVGMDGAVEVYGRLPVELYLRGVLPAEMPAGWPDEALKAQAVVARSEIFASLAGKYKLEGFDFTALEGCRAYLGIGGHHPNTDAAVAATAGQALTRDNKFATTVFSACCGGWTENNENVWSGPPNMALRGKPDFDAQQQVSAPTSEGGWRTQITGRPAAWCAPGNDTFRWQKRFSVAELSELVNRRHNVGTVRAIHTGARGVSGRLRSVTIEGSAGSATIERELAIRQLFGGLPSAMFIIETLPAGGTPSSFVFYGGGRGHGVGMCQYGARGMAAAGRKVEEIVTHYFTGVSIERTR